VGAVQANMTVFGAEQVRGQKNKTRYFDIYYAVINTGGLIAFGAIAYLQLNIHNGYFVGYLTSGILLTSAFVFYLIGYKFYVHVKPHDSLLTHFFPVVINAFQTWKNYHRNGREINGGNELHPDDTVVEAEGDSNVYLSFTVNRSTWSFLDYAKVTYHGRFSEQVVNDMKSLRRIIVVFLLLTPYWLLYVQVIDLFIKFNMKNIFHIGRNNIYCSRCSYEITCII
jgi:peptide/histidine transporter 3/4